MRGGAAANGSALPAVPFVSTRKATVQPISGCWWWVAYFPVLNFGSGGAYCLSDTKTIIFSSCKYALNEALKLQQNLRIS